MSATLRHGPTRDTLVLTSNRGRFSLRLSRSSLLLTSLAGLAAVAVAAVSLTMGVFPLSAGEVFTILGGGGTLIERSVVLDDRLPRALTGLGVGAAFALSGAILQRIAANPLVSPDIIGINAGAALGATFTLLVLGGGGMDLALGALTGAAIAAATILLIAYKGGLHGYRLVLVGIGVAAMMSSGLSFLLTRSDISRAMNAAAWLTGSLAQRSMLHVTMIVVALLVCVPALIIGSSHLRLLELGDDLTRTLTGAGQSRKILLLAVAIVLAALATSAAGPIGFVALVAPQIARRILAERQVSLAPSAAIGALMVVSADLSARLLFAPAEMPVGVMTAVLGAPVLLYLLARAHKIGSAG